MVISRCIAYIPITHIVEIFKTKEKESESIIAYESRKMALFIFSYPYNKKIKNKETTTAEE